MKRSVSTALYPGSLLLLAAIALSSVPGVQAVAGAMLLIGWPCVVGYRYRSALGIEGGALSLSLVGSFITFAVLLSSVRIPFSRIVFVIGIVVIYGAFWLYASHRSSAVTLESSSTPAVEDVGRAPRLRVSPSLLVGAAGAFVVCACAIAISVVGSHRQDQTGVRISLSALPSANSLGPGYEVTNFGSDPVELDLVESDAAGARTLTRTVKAGDVFTRRLSSARLPTTVVLSPSGGAAVSKQRIVVK